MKNGKKTNNGRNRTARSRKNQNTWRKGKLQVLENVGSGQHQISGDKRKNNKRLPQTTEKKLLETKFFWRNLIKEIKTWTVLPARYSEPFLKWAREEHWQIDQSTKKLMTMHKAFHPRDSIDYMSQEKKKEKKLSALKIFNYIRACIAEGDLFIGDTMCYSKFSTSPPIIGQYCVWCLV